MNYFGENRLLLGVVSGVFPVSVEVVGTTIVELDLSIQNAVAQRTAEGDNCAVIDHLLSQFFPLCNVSSGAGGQLVQLSQQSILCFTVVA